MNKVRYIGDWAVQTGLIIALADSSALAYPIP